MHDKVINGVRINIVCNAVSLTIVAILVWTLPDIPEETQSDDNICIDTDNGIKCDQTAFILHKTLNYHVEEQFKTMKNMNEEKIQKRFNNENTRKLFRLKFWEMKPAAKVIGKHISQHTNYEYDLGMVPLKHWSHARDPYNQNVYLWNGVTYRDGRLVVPVSGTYLVYAYVEFNVPSQYENGLPDKESHARHLQLGLYKFNILEGREVVLARSTNPLCSKTVYFSNSLVNSVVDLHAGDELSVKVNKQTHIINGEHNFFGLNLL